MKHHASHDIFIEAIEPFFNDLQKLFSDSDKFIRYNFFKNVFRKKKKGIFRIEKSDNTLFSEIVKKHYGKSVIFSKHPYPEKFIKNVKKTFEVILGLVSNQEISNDIGSKYLTFFFLIIANYYLYEICSAEQLKEPGKKLYEYRNTIVDFSFDTPPPNGAGWKELPYENVYEILVIEIRERILMYFKNIEYEHNLSNVLNELNSFLPKELTKWLAQSRKRDETRI